MRDKISFFLVGAQRGGTTTLFELLAQNPGIYLPAIKEVLFFSSDDFYAQGEKYLEPYYREAGAGRKIDLVDPMILAFPRALDRVYAYNAEARCIAILRNPVDRAYSAYWMARSFGWEQLDFEAAIAEDARRTRAGYSLACLAYLSVGHYAEQLQPWYRRFGRDRLLVRFTDDLTGSVRQLLDDVSDFLGVPAAPGVIDVSTKSNSAFTARSLAAMKVLMNFDAPYRKMVQKYLPARMRRWITQNITFPLVEANTRPTTHPPMNPETRARLVEYYRPQIEALQELCGRDLQHWLR